MRIKQIELKGFKSFKNRTVIRFGQGITGIVGPNGCGKSNIVDAFLWVMGETAPGLLRGASMEDVIFTGTAGRPPAGVAEVSLVLEPSERCSFPELYKNVSELMVTRRLDRDGKSDYFINTQLVRLKDVQDIFIDTGAGRRGVGFIEQGAVERFISARPEQKRQLIESAAGLSKFRLKQKEALKKMELTAVHICRVDDILKQKTSQLKKLKKQSEKAEKHRTLKKQIQEQDLQISRRNLNVLQNKHTALSRQLKTLEEKQAQQKQALQTSPAFGSRDISSLQRQKKEQARFEQEEYHRINKLYLSVLEQTRVLEQSIAEENKTAELLLEQTRGAGRQLELVLSNVRDWGGLLTQKQALLKDLSRREAQTHEDLQKAQQKQNTYTAQQQTLAKRLSNLQKQLLLSEEKLQKARVKYAQLAVQKENLMKQAESSPWAAGLKFILKDLKLPGCQAGPEEDILTSLPDAVQPAAYELLKFRLQALFCDNTETMLKAIKSLKEHSNPTPPSLREGGRGGGAQNKASGLKALFILKSLINEADLENEKAQLKTQAGFEFFLSDKLMNTKQPFARLLCARTACVQDLPSALRLKKLHPAWGFVTLTGEVVSWGGEAAAGSIHLGPSYQEHLKKAAQLLHDSKMQVVSLEKEQKAVKDLLTCQSEEHSAVNTKAAQAQKNVWELTKQKQGLAHQLSFLKQEITSLQSKLEEFESTKLRLQTKAYSPGGQKAAILPKDKDQKLQQLSAQKAKLFKELSQKSALAKRAHKECEELERKESERRQQFIQQQQDLAEQESLISDLKLKMADLANQQTILIDRMHERYHVDLPSLQAPADHSAAADVSPALALQQLDELNQQLARMGEVNWLALSEYEALNKEKCFYEKQYQDLCTAKEQLLSVMKRMDRFCAGKFQAVFEEVNKYFSKVFASLFAGGRAELILTDKEGVEVIVQPPSKKIQNLNLLSGGEKAMTAAAVIFSLFLVKPSPFCVLDEVDAPLDDANVMRFSSLLSEMANVSQVLIITHNKRTMQICDQLYGVTMEEKGISKILSLDNTSAPLRNKNPAPSPGGLTTPPSS